MKMNDKESMPEDGAPGVPTCGEIAGGILEWCESAGVEDVAVVEAMARVLWVTWASSRKGRAQTRVCLEKIWRGMDAALERKKVLAGKVGG